MIPRLSPALLREALKEDLGSRGDVTTRYMLRAGRRYRAEIAAKDEGVLCGVDIAQTVFRAVCPKARVRVLKKDGEAVKRGEMVMRLEGPREILSAERLALNFLQRLSGIATLTSRFVKAAAGSRARIYDTRKTTPGYRALEKYAVRCGGGENHRVGLYDAVLIKDNHLRAGRFNGRDLKAVVEKMRRELPGLAIEMEAQSLSEVKHALACDLDIILLDNFSLAELEEAVWLVGAHRKLNESAHPLIEVSGGVNLDTVRSIAALGVDRISVGQITHSARALDLSLELA